MDYFAQFPTVYYTFDPAKQEFFTLRNLFTRVIDIQSVLQNSLVYYEYTMKDTDTLESIAFKYYGDPLRWWIIMFANVMIDPYFDVVLKQTDFDANIVVKYGSIEQAQNTLAMITQTQTVITTINGSSNTRIYNTSVANTGYTYDFRLKQLIPQTLPTIDLPIIKLSDVTVVTPDGSIVETVTTLNAVTCYDNEVAINEAKRQIVLIDKSYAGQIEQQFQSLLA
jgi:hypothetical protein